MTGPLNISGDETAASVPNEKLAAEQEMNLAEPENRIIKAEAQLLDRLKQSKADLQMKPMAQLSDLKPSK